ncbi:LytR/AlgR family response regulator transcription factor [Aegicerativicinus sediminis]|uniref:LytR/AlgR family response regulator transcription factor n=1 Tax=Aegicerativicinus sediminis TaxID=2893202 RepID=UPI001E2F6D48|nr:LytTR family DNA-binding domain-containing protein [Aegicerativicinus sediminis]
MKIRCVILDDEPMAVDVILEHLKNFDNIDVIGTFNTPKKALNFIEKEKVDLIFLDLNMPQMGGFEFIEKLSKSPLIVLTTAYREYAVKSYELNVLDYLVKPIPFNRFLKTINKIYQKLFNDIPGLDNGLQQEPHIFLKVSKKLVKVNLNDILYIESLKDYIKVVTLIGDFVVYKSLTAISEELPVSNFLQVHRSYTIAINKIESVEGNLVEISGRKIPIGRNYVKVAKERIFQSSEKNL